jgi:tetratricopeptide (TPR) repeat protein
VKSPGAVDGSKTLAAADDAPLQRLLAVLAEVRAGTEGNQADGLGPGTLDFDELASIWSQTRRAGVSALMQSSLAAPGTGPVQLALERLQRGEVQGLIAWLSEQETAALAGARAETGTAALTLRLDVARLARQQGALTLGINNQTALAAFRRALEHDGNDPWSQTAVADLLAQASDQASAAAAYRAASQLFKAQTAPGGQPTASLGAAASAKGLLHAQVVTTYRRGEMLAYLEKRDEAVAAYREALGHAEALLLLDKRPERMFEVTNVSDRLADQLAAQNNWAEALAAHKRSLALAEVLAQGDPEGEAQWQFYMFDKHEHIADLQLASGEADVALTSYRTGLEMGEKLVTLDITNDAWLGGLLNLIAKVGATSNLDQTGEERRQLVLRGLELLGRVRSGEVWDNQDEWGDRLRQILTELPPPDGT